VIKSVYYSQDDILLAINELHLETWFQVDLTFGNGSFWKNIKRPELCMDICPLDDSVIENNSAHIKLEKETVSSVVFDPPFLTYVKKPVRGESKWVMGKRFGGYWAYAELENHYKKTIAECYRVLKKKGILVFKCQDIIHNHKIHPTHINIVNWAEGFRLKDLFILAAKNRMPGPQKGKQRHARIFHSYFLVLEKL